MNPEKFQRRLNELEKAFKELYTKAAPRAAGVAARRLFKENFKKQSFFGNKWKEVNRRRGVKGGKGKAWSRRRILAGESGDLRRSISFKIDDKGTATIFTNPKEFTTSKEPYGRVHNEGLRAGRGKGFKMPKRQFIGDHARLRKEIVEEIEKKVKEIFNHN